MTLGLSFLFFHFHREDKTTPSAPISIPINTAGSPLSTSSTSRVHSVNTCNPSFPMAAMLESLPIPRPSSIRSSVPTHAACAVSACARKTGLLLPDYKGLRIETSAPRITLALTRRRTGRTQRGGIVCEAQETAVDVPAVTDTTWKSLVLEGDLPVLVEFWAPWCGPCRMIHPIIDELARQYAGKLKCYKLNTDESASIATQYGIRSIPTVMIFKNGDKKDAIIGAVPKNTLTACIDKFL
ncbi:hypothetical protein MRB53_004575 [Persea americana]|uniref:Uncharacterized protein n=1 Tax=Persea americana TaxID=3435 RepID=A0ACC2MCD6_PERAE|nr:hypothetical protein MRB53_004575 [Persea americana]